MMHFTSFSARRLHNLFYPKVGEVWMLHRVVECHDGTLRQHPIEVELSYLAARIDALIASGTHICPISDVPQHIATRRSFVCLTFDDGYLDTFTLAYPMLKERQLPFCVYATRNFYRGYAHPQWMPGVPMMEASHLRLLASDPLCTIGAHTCSHPRLSGLTREEQWHEIANCKDDLEQLLGQPVLHMAYPHGDYNQTTTDLCRKAGFHTATAANGRTVRTDAKPMCIDRVTISQF